MNALKRVQPAGTASTESDQLVRQGKQVAEKSCGRCHAVGAKDVSRDKNATEFRNLSRRHPNLTLRAPIERAIAVTHDAMPSFNLSSAEIEAIIAYIGSSCSGRLGIERAAGQIHRSSHGASMFRQPRSKQGTVAMTLPASLRSN